jgi:o-succinylbenzoate---CoA ligase
MESRLHYDFDDILVNGRVVKLGRIVNGDESTLTSFEKDTLGFIQNWFRGTPVFHFQTSGSTGKPRKISFTREQMTISAMSSIQALALRSADTALICLSTRFVAGVMMLVRAFVNNMRIVAVDPSSNPLQAVDTAQKIDFAAIVPLQMQSMLDHQLQDRLNLIRTIIVGGASVSHSLKVRILEQLCQNVFITYGMTETLSHVALDHVISLESVFTPLPDVQVALDGRGCLVINAPAVSGPVVTNDLGELLPDSRFRWLGRYDNAINSGSIKVIPEKMEEELAEIFSRLNILRNYFVGGKPDPRLGNQVVLVIEGKSMPQDEIKSLRDELTGQFSAYERPSIVFADRFIYTETGKIKRNQTLQRIIQEDEEGI